MNTVPPSGTYEMLDPRIHKLVAAQPYPLVFATVTAPSFGAVHES